MVKNGSNAFSMTAASMPVPVSATDSRTYSPAGISSCAAAWSARATLAVPIASGPPAGIASRALMHRLSSAFSNCGTSTSTAHGAGARSVEMAMDGPSVREMISSIPPTIASTTTGVGARVCRREKASSRWVNAVARAALACAISR